MGRFKPGQSGNPNGRPPGRPNKATKQAKQFIADFLEEEQELAAKDWQKLTPWERWQLRSRLFEYVAPKLARTETTLDINKLSDDEVERLLETAIKTLENG